MVHLGKTEIKGAGESPPSPKKPHNLPRDPAMPDPASPPQAQDFQARVQSHEWTMFLAQSDGLWSCSPPQRRSTGSIRPVSQQQGRDGDSDKPIATVAQRAPQRSSHSSHEFLWRSRGSWKFPLTFGLRTSTSLETPCFYWHQKNLGRLCKKPPALYIQNNGYRV